MNVNLHIERLVLDGIDVEPAQQGNWAQPGIQIAGAVYGGIGK